MFKLTKVDYMRKFTILCSDIVLSSREINIKKKITIGKQLLNNNDDEWLVMTSDNSEKHGVRFSDLVHAKLLSDRTVNRKFENKHLKVSYKIPLLFIVIH